MVECFVERAAVPDVQRLQEALDALDGAVEDGLSASEVMRVRDDFYEALLRAVVQAVVECDGPRAAALMREHIAFAAATLRTLPRPD